MVQKTKDYTIFKEHPSNMRYEPSFVEKLKKSIQLNDMLEFRPILVDSEMRILDGRQRLAAARSLGLFIYYEKNENGKTQDIRLLNVHKSWTLNDYLEYHMGANNRHYQKMSNWMKEKKINVGTALKVLFGSRNLLILNKFKDGDLEFPNRERIEEIEEYYVKLNRAIEYVLEKKIYGKKFVKGTRFRETLMDFIMNPKIDFDIFMKKIELKMDAIRKCPTTQSYRNMFKDIYNYKNSNPVD